ncbi:type IX secretion system membrane protein PorP/SprF [Pedobacter sp. HMF7647]|uniref:Type IX secretion system membrane protein PorP/SprF n=1 Tax=Hufsiella arboris TaxID=2695275 RepID=A0A7K1YD86_9SPHI|nr:type IX secretion system membrane protein PorP/SprF [Hufsiella arboris]MXV52554.1 type IX secretion system membrane protein PorP/SprF [Hufsiella arboris]
MKRLINLYNLFLLIVLLAIAGRVQAQLLPLNAQYYQNKYLSNPAFAGIDAGYSINGSFRKQWSNIPGSPITQAVTFDAQAGKTGWGINFFNEKSGGLQRTKAVATYAYHLPLGDNDQKLNFGLSVGALRDHLDMDDVNDPNDPSVARFNDRGTVVDADFGLAYTDKNLSVEAALPNMRMLFDREDDERYYSDRPTFYSAVGYKFTFGEAMNAIGVEPKVAYRGVKNFDDLWDAGVNVSLVNNKVFLMGMYHNTENATFGFGMNFKSTLSVMGFYDTNTSELNGYSNGNFEVSLRVNLKK